MKRSFAALMAFVLLIAIVGLSAHLVVLEINDTHGHAWPYGNYGGFAAIATIVNQVRAEAQANGWDFLFLHAGDVNTGVPESDMLYARPDILALDMMGLDAMTIGNHEFDHPWSVLSRQMAWADFPFLSANIVYKGTDKTVGQPYLIEKFPDLKVAILGLTTKTTEYIGNPEYVKGYDFLSPDEVAQKYVPMLQKMVEPDGIVIALTHLGIFGYSEQTVAGTPGAVETAEKLDPPNNPYGGSVSLAQSVSGIAAIFDGHSHTAVTSPFNVNGTLIVQAGSYSKYIARLDLIVENGHVATYTYKLITVSKDIKPDEAVQDLLNAYKIVGSAKLNEPIGYSKVNFANEKDSTRKADTLIGHLITDAVAWKFKDMGIQAVLMNGGGIRAPIPAGTITYRTVLTVLPFGNTVVILKIKGSDLLKAIQWGAVYHPEDTGARLNEWGLTYTVTPQGVENILLDGKPIDPNVIYTVATNDYMANGGDNYSMLKNAQQYNTGYVLADVVKEYIEHISPIESYPFTPRWTEVE
ncbi:MAG: 5'-nucleotidase C-terminal domain-containing protein [Athalassotoga sp.]|uniref:5'-nucleotidase C-terminal domain-containing protein n=1 Tax=Athalassotoga sp. TaxID=2022597 RepID=UPI003D01CA97